MSRPISYTSAVTVNVTSYSGCTSAITAATGTNAPSEGLNGSGNSTTYAMFSGSTRYASGFVYYLFDVSDIPANATINSVACTARGARRYNSGTTQFQLIAGTTLKGSPTTVSASGTSASGQTYVLTTGTWTRSELNNIALRIYSVKTSSRNGSHVIRFNGATLTVNYSVNGTEYEITINNSSTATTQPTGTTYVFQGGDQEVLILNVQSLDDIVVKDNGTVVTPVAYIQISETFIPSSLVASSGSVTNPNNGLTDTASTTYAQTNGQSGHYLTYAFDVSSIPQNATINSVTCQAKVEHTRSTAAGSVQLYSGTNAKGSASTFGNTATVVNLTTGTWTRSELNDIRIRVGNTYNGGTTTYYTRFYGANLVINYTAPGTGGTILYYSYTISNISADHTITVEDAGQRAQVKLNGAWVSVTDVYKKVSGGWVKQTNLDDLFNPTGTIYVRGN